MKTEKKETPKKRVRRYKCVLCKQSTDWQSVRRPPANPKHLAVMLSSHVLSGEVDLVHAKFSFEACLDVPKEICRVHFGDAAKQLAMELIALGVPFTSFGDGSTRYGMTAFVDQYDIPKKFLTRINEVVGKIDKDLLVTKEDVTMYVNEFLLQYLCRNRTNTEWDAVSRLLPGIKRRITEEVQEKPHREKKPVDVEDPVKPSTVLPPSSSQLSSSEINENHSHDIKPGDGSNKVVYEVPVSQVTVTSCDSSMKVESDSDSVNIMPISAFDLARSLPRLAATSQELLQRYVTVSVESLLKLFQFCPHCGQKLEVDGSVQLIMHKAVPVVQYVCDKCSQNGSVVKSWNAQ